MADRIQLRPSGTLDGVRQILEQALLAEGFQCTWQTPQQGVTEKGSTVRALLLGAFSPHYKYGVTLAPQMDGSVVVELSLMATGAVGGAVGVVKVRKKLEALERALGQAFQNAAAPQAGHSG